jgi:hypothetical protein
MDCSRKDSGRFSAVYLRLAVAALACGLSLSIGPPAACQSAAGTRSDSTAPEFKRLAGKLAADRAEEVEEPEAVEEQALEILDREALGFLNMAAPDLDMLNQRLAVFVTHEPPIGEGYRAFKLGGEPAAFALLADFGEGGPSAVRVYAGLPGKLALAGRVDRYTQKDFIDDYMELVPVPGPVALFVTVAGRTDDFKTGVFTAWHFDGRRVEQVWASDILEQSSYDANAGGFELNYCAEPDPVDEHTCHQMRHEHYAWQGGAWKQAESAP